MTSVCLVSLLSNQTFVLFIIVHTIYLSSANFYGTAFRFSIAPPLRLLGLRRQLILLLPNKTIENPVVLKEGGDLKDASDGVGRRGKYRRLTERSDPFSRFAKNPRLTGSSCYALFRPPNFFKIFRFGA